MIFTVPLQPGTSLVNVLYKWLVSGAFLAPTSSGVTQPDSNIPYFRIDTSATLVRNKETGQLVTQRVITANIVLGQLQDVNANAYVGLTRTDYMLDQNGIALPRMRYLLTCPQLGAPVGLGLLATAGPIAFLPVTFVLDTTNTNVSGAGVLDISKLKPT